MALADLDKIYVMYGAEDILVSVRNFLLKDNDPSSVSDIYNKVDILNTALEEKRCKIYFFNSLGKPEGIVGAYNILEAKWTTDKNPSKLTVTSKSSKG